MNEERKKYLRVFLIFFAVISVLQILDVVFTSYMISKEGVDVEKNPIMKILFDQRKGSWSVLLVKIGVMLAWFVPAWLWVNHPINFYKKYQRNTFLFVPSFITALYLMVIISQIVQIGVFHLWF